VREGGERKRIYRMYIIGRKEGRKSGVRQREGRGRYCGNWRVIK